ncbi:unnamed protein product [Parascedosporium putredinis]|uniref:rRNA adenine N(6)-methyltransferase n=1 Tax=Parascedosporium putredinis TaxID=1442378 RepID=A0A9P1MEE1_9PEZI|nr:unnamed protein product [Parascedosporium putredinis]CAI8002466.1 unnamed protein product [Parascedosporium putredinis]
MAKAQRAKRNGSAPSSPYQKPAAAKKAPIFKFNTKIGQHILKNPAIADAIVAKAHIQPVETVLEIGPGTGVLTTRILDHAKNVIAVELDPRMAAELSCVVQGTPKQQKLQIVLGDFIKLESSELKPFDVCISNTPYQREFALRLIARPGDSLYSRLSVNTQFFSKVSHVMKVSKKNFTPPPQVESSVVRIEPRTDRPNISWDEWDGMLRVCFMRKNKTLKATWTGNKVRAMVEQNWITWATINTEAVSEKDWKVLRGEESVDDQAAGEEADAMDEDGDEDMGGGNVSGGDEPDAEEDNTTLRRLAGIKLNKGLIAAKIRRVLDSTGLGSQRAAKCDETDFCTS